MSTLRAEAATWLLSGRRAVIVEVVEARGSAPRDAGTRMLVGATRSIGTVGGGHLELQALATARALLAGDLPWPESSALKSSRLTRHYPLGPALGQCCGGAVTLAFAPLDADAIARWPVEPPLFRLQLFGAGHVGRAVARALMPLPVEVDWIDEREAEFPAEFGEPGGAWPEHIRKVCVDAVEGEVATAPPDAFFLVLTHRHDLDLRIAEAILRRDAAPGYFGMIGSKTKRERFIHRFEALGFEADRIARMTCPIGLPGIASKEPALIAVAVVAQLVMVAGRAAGGIPNFEAQAGRGARAATQRMP
jgi:xanthine dehydrogenase accessory factor